MSRGRSLTEEDVLIRVGVYASRWYMSTCPTGDVPVSVPVTVFTVGDLNGVERGVW